MIGLVVGIVVVVYVLRVCEEVYVINANGSGQTNLTNNSARDINPGWSPDGKKITFASNRQGDFDIFTMGADGSNQTNLTNSPTVAEIDPDWQPLAGAGDGNDGGGGGGGGGGNNDHNNRFHNNRFDHNRFFARGAADNQYRSERIVEERVIRETIPNKGTLADTGGMPLAGVAFLSLAMVGLGVSILRSAIRPER